jgi:GNAT superfamily N-acetyltransferase
MASTLRPATFADLDGIVAVFLACWRNNYVRVMPERLVSSMTTERAKTLWEPALREDAPADGGPVVVVAAETSGGVPAAGGGHPTVCGVTRWSLQEGQGTIHSLYVDPALQGGGVGALLLQAAEDGIAAAGAATATLWVFGDNTPSLAFYRRRGWAPDGVVRTSTEFGEPEVRLAKVLKEAGPAA